MKCIFSVDIRSMNAQFSSCLHLTRCWPVRSIRDYVLILYLWMFASCIRKSIALLLVQTRNYLWMIHKLLYFLFQCGIFRLVNAVSSIWLLQNGKWLLHMPLLYLIDGWSWMMSFIDQDETCRRHNVSESITCTCWIMFTSLNVCLNTRAFEKGSKYSTNISGNIDQKKYQKYYIYALICFCRKVRIKDSFSSRFYVLPFKLCAHKLVGCFIVSSC